MKTLDEVIKAFEHCTDQNPDPDYDVCAKCPYCDEIKGCYSHMTDALHYLKELRDMTDIPMEYFEYGGTSQKLRNTSQISCPKCHSEFVILDNPDGDHAQLLKCQALLQDFYRNDPLDWNELKQMEGKPVWIELYGSDFDEWVLIHAWNDDIMWFADCNGTLYTEKECRLGQTWRAYRKERE